MGEKKFTLLHTHDTLELYSTFYPFLVSKISRFIDFRYFPTFDFRPKTDQVLFIRLFKGRFDDQDYVNETLQRLRDLYSRVHYLDDSDGADSFHFEFIDAVDTYYKGKLPRDLSICSQPLYGRQIFSDYYHRTFGVSDGDAESVREPVENPGQLEKVRPAFNLGYGIYPLPGSRTLIRKLTYFLCRRGGIEKLKPWFRYRHRELIRQLEKPVDFSSKTLKISARFRYEGYPSSIGYQRKLMEGIAKTNPAFLTGLTSREQFLKELASAVATLSPFGYGEVCLRDFEAVLNGSLLIKPDVSHMKSEPDLYIPNETYLPVKWDGSDLESVADRVLSEPKRYASIVANARSVYREALLSIDDQVEKRFSELF